jgi:membrane-associated phospholipid phosphatase
MKASRDNMGANHPSAILVPASQAVPTPAAQSVLAWPGWAHLRFAWLQTFFVSLLFATVYSGTNWVTAQRAARIRIHFDSELQLPLVPSFTLIYMSIYALFLAVPFVLRTRREIVHLAGAQTITIVIAGICFLLVPARLAFAPPTDSELGSWRELFHFADRLNLDYNLVPSLHVALSVVCIEMFASRAGSGGKLFLRGWGVLIAASTLLTHQHHFLDVITGFLLALTVIKCMRRSRHRIWQ